MVFHWEIHMIILMFSYRFYNNLQILFFQGLCVCVWSNSTESSFKTASKHTFLTKILSYMHCLNAAITSNIWNKSDSEITEFLSLNCDHIVFVTSEWRKILCHKLHYFITKSQHWVNKIFCTSNMIPKKCLISFKSTFSVLHISLKEFEFFWNSGQLSSCRK